MESITVADVLSWEPCGDYPEGRIRELWRGREALTAAEWTALPVPAADIVWLATRPGVLGLAEVCQWVGRVAGRVVERHAAPAAVVADWAQKWLDGSDRGHCAACDAGERAWAVEADAAAHAADTAKWAARLADYVREGAAAMTLEPVGRASYAQSMGWAAFESAASAARAAARAADYGREGAAAMTLAPVGRASYAQSMGWAALESAAGAARDEVSLWGRDAEEAERRAQVEDLRAILGVASQNSGPHT